MHCRKDSPAGSGRRSFSAILSASNVSSAFKLLDNDQPTTRRDHTSNTTAR